MWPLIMGPDLGGNLRKVVAVNPGKFVKNPFFSANSSVDNVGENNAACANSTNSAGVAEAMMLAAVC